MNSQQSKLVEDYWHARLDGAQAVTLASGGDHAEAAARRDLSAGTAARLRSLAGGSALGVAILGLGLLDVVLRRYARSDDLTLGTFMPADGASPGNPIACRTQLRGDMELAAALAAVKQTVQEAIAHGGLPHHELRERLRRRDTRLADDLPGVLFRAAALHADLPAPSAFELLFTLDDDGQDGAVGLVHHLGPDRAPLVDRLLAAWADLLAGFTAHLATPLARLPILPAAERQRILALATNAAGWPTGATVAELWREAARRHAARPAVTHEGQTLTYAELDGRVNRLAARLRDAGADRGKLVALLVDRSADLVAAILAVVATGAAYVPIEPDLPAERIRFLLADSGACVVLTSGPGRDELAPAARWLRLDRRGMDPAVSAAEWQRGLIDEPGLAREPVSQLPLVAQPDDLLYVIYTSGTTGRPKGVLVEHRHVVRLLFNDRVPFRFGADDTWTLFHSYAFDFSVWEIYGALLHGGRLVVVPRMTARDPAAFAELLGRERVTVLNQTPSAFYGLVDQTAPPFGGAAARGRAPVVDADAARPARLEALRYVIFGGEALDPGKLAGWRRRHPATALVNMYGITETTVHVTYKAIGEAEIAAGVSNIGRAIPTLSTYVVDEQLELVPLGVEGELCVGGDGVARGYLDRDELTAARFVPSPFRAGERLYRSGDLVRMLESGDLEYRGRMDRQVKVRGFRIETGEIEAELARHPAVARALVVARGTGQAAYLCAYVEIADRASAAERDRLADDLRARLTAVLPDYMVPAHFVAVDHIPLTANAKVDLAALPDPRPAAARPAGHATAATSIEARLRALWSAVIGADAGDAPSERSFFELGGDSILAVRLVSLVNETFGVRIRIPDLYLHDTLAALAALVGAAAPVADDRGERAAVATELARLRERVASTAGACPRPSAPPKGGAVLSTDPAELDDVYPATEIEQAMVLHGRSGQGEALYHDQLLYELSAPDFDPDRLRRALTLLGEKHCALRSRFVLDHPDGPLHLVDRHARVEYAHTDLDGLDRRGQSDAVRAWLAGDRGRSFSPDDGPLWRTHTFACGERVVLALVAHHAILDGWSASLLLRELDAVYRRLGHDPDFRPDPLRSRYREHVVQQLLERDRPEAAAFWRAELLGFTPLDRLADVRPDATREVREVRRELPAALAAAARARGVPLKTLCLSAALGALAMFNYHADMVVGLVTHDRPTCLDGERLLGCFLNTIPLRVRMPAAGTWADLVHQVEERLRAVRPHERMPLAEIIRATGEDGRRGNPFFAAFFNYTDFGDDGALVGEADRQVDAAGHVRTEMLLEITVDATGGRLAVLVSHALAALGPAEGDRLIDYVERALERIVHQPDRPIRKLDLVGDDERRAMVAVQVADREVALGPTVAAAFAAQVARTPDRVALVWDGGRWSYAELAARAERIAAVLRAAGVVREAVVAVLVERSPDMVAAVLGVIAAGGAYLPLDPEQPDGRIDEILAAAGTAHLVTTTAEIARRAIRWLDGAGRPGGGAALTLIALDQLDEPGFAGRGSAPESERGVIDAFPTAPPSPGEGNADDLLYVIATSGSTGVPKCVMIEHATILNLAEYTGRDMGLPARPVVLQLASLAFDVSAQEMFPTLLNGGELHLIPSEVRRDVPRLLSLIERRGVEVVHLPPSLLDILFADAELAAAVPSCVRHFVAAGEALVVGPHLRDAVRAGRFALHNHYGPTETHLALALAFPPGSDVPTRPAVGRPPANLHIVLLDENGMIQPLGAPGDVHIGGRSVGRGYLGRDDLTAERFSRGLPELARTERIYRSGDLGRWNPDGTLDYLGRLDQQVKIRGFRVELGEIEERLRRLDGVADAVVVDRSDGGGRRRLVAHVVPRAGRVVADEAASWRAQLSESLPDYMVPGLFVGIDEVPHATSGKVDRKRLRAAPIAAPSGVRPALPADPVTAELAALWAATLGLDVAELAADADFFTLGGHSLRATLLAARVERAFGVALPLADVYRDPSLAGMAARIRAGVRRRHDPIVALPPQPHYPVSPAQRRFFVLAALAPESLAYNLPLAIDLRGAVDPIRLARALDALVARHAALRSAFVLDGGDVRQRIAEATACPLDVVDAADDDVADRIAAFVRPFDLGRPPLVRALLLRTDPNGATLVLDFHHIATDGVSTGILMRDLMALYAGQVPPPPRLRYVDYVAWLDAPEQAERRSRQADYWRARLGGELSVLELPTDRPRPPVRSSDGALVRFALPSAVADGWRRLAREAGTSLFAIGLAAFHVFLTRLTGQDTTVVGTPVSGRNHADVDQIVGVFVNTLALAHRAAPRLRFRAFAAEVGRSTLEALEHQDYPFEDLVERLAVTRDPGRNPLFDAFFSLAAAELGLPDVAGLRAVPRDTEIVSSKFDLSLYLAERDGGLEAVLEYATELFDADMAARFARRFAALAARIAADPDALITSLNVIDDEERAVLMRAATSPAPRPAADRPTLAALFDAAARRFADRIALVPAAGPPLTYAMLRDRTMRLAGALSARGVRRGSVIALRLERSVDFVCAVFGVLAAGGGYLPIDPKTPAERTAFMLRDTGASLVLSGDDPGVAELAGTPVLAVTALVAEGGPLPSANRPDPDDLACLLYTSGSTGVPKAVALEHRAVATTILGLQRAHPLGGDGVYLHKTASTFDVSAAELFGWFHDGGRLALLEPGGERDPLAISAAIARHRVTHVNFVPSMFGAWVDGLDPAAAAQMQSLRHVFSAGEKMVRGPVERFRALCPTTKVHNLYGPTEAAIYCSGFSLDEDDGRGEIPIGRPLPGVTLRILDQDGGLAPIGVVGELAIGGDGLARGYFGRPDLTAAAFIPDAFAHDAVGARLYRTGDAARWRPDGILEFRGRIDHQVKVRGFRVELGEVEAAMLRCAGVARAAVTVRGVAGGDAGLCGYYVVEHGGDPAAIEQALRERLAATLPEYMVPARLVRLAALPLTASGKIDRRALPAPPLLATGERPAIAGPDDAIERAVAAAWAQALGGEPASLDDNFFDLGGTSLGLVRVQSLLRETFGRDIPVAALFRFPTVRTQAAYLRDPPAERDAAPALDPARRDRLLARRRRIR